MLDLKDIKPGVKVVCIQDNYYCRKGHVAIIYSKDDCGDLDFWITGDVDENPLVNLAWLNFNRICQGVENWKLLESDYSSLILTKKLKRRIS